LVDFTQKRHDKPLSNLACSLEFDGVVGLSWPTVEW